MTTTWTCPKCQRRFTRKNQRHACGTGDRAELLRNRPRKVEHELFVKVAADRRQVTHVAKLRRLGELEMMTPLLREAYEFSIS